MTSSGKIRIYELSKDLNLDNKDYLFISGKNSGALLTEIKTNNNLKVNKLEKVFEKRLLNEKI